MRATPHSLSPSIALSVSNGVALGVTVVRRPKRTLVCSNGKRSGRFKGSPPVKTISGSRRRGNERRPDRKPESVPRSPGTEPHRSSSLPFPLLDRVTVEREAYTGYGDNRIENKLGALEQPDQLDRY